MSGYEADGFWVYDFDSKTTKQIKDLGSVAQGPIFGEEEYDYQTGTMYCGNSFSSAGSTLQILDPSTGKHNCGRQLHPGPLHRKGSAVS